MDGGRPVEFFAQGRLASGSSLPTVEISHPFLWYWDAFPVRNGWRYVNRAGREQDLVRTDVAEDQWSIEIRALEFRQYLAAHGRDAVVQVDIVTTAALNELERVDDEFSSEWAHVDVYALYHPSTGARPAFSRVMGRYLLRGMRNSRVPRFEERLQPKNFIEFLYGVNASTGAPLTHSCNPDELGTYFDTGSDRLHYLTPIYFKRAVLQPYLAEPNRYVVTATRLECMALWAGHLNQHRWTGRGIPRRSRSGPPSGRVGALAFVQRASRG